MFVGAVTNYTRPRGFMEEEKPFEVHELFRVCHNKEIPPYHGFLVMKF